MHEARAEEIALRSKEPTLLGGGLVGPVFL